MSDLLSVEHIRQGMPSTISSIYLNAGTFGPLPVSAVEAIEQQMQKELQKGRLGSETFETITNTYQSARQAVARLLHAQEDEIALTDNTGEGLNIICFSLNWQPGDEIITSNHEHFSLLAPLNQLHDRYGVVIHTADLGPQADRPIVEAISEHVTERTRLVACSHVTWTNGSRLDLPELSAFCHQRGILVLIDGAQSAGAIPISVHDLGVDFYAIPGQKWLCGPDGTGALYASAEIIPATTSTYVGYWSAEDAHGAWKLASNAKRFEVGGRQTAAIAGQAAALKWLEETIGYDWIFARIAQLHTYAYEALQSLPGLQILTPRAGASGLLTFIPQGQDVEKLVISLREQHNIYTRTIPEISAVRISTGFYNTEEEIDRLLQALKEYV